MDRYKILKNKEEPITSERAEELEIIESFVHTSNPNMKKFLSALKVPKNDGQKKIFYRTISTVSDNL
jgi:hypothetical protein